jgi:hypothetical protein
VSVLEVDGGSSALDYETTAEWPDDVVELVRAVHRAGDRSGAQAEELALLRPFALAPAVILRTNEPARFLKEIVPAFLTEFGDPCRYEGFYFEVLDSKGELVWQWAGSSRLSRGGVWTRPDLEGCNPVVHSQPVGAEIPPCPA